MKRFINRRFRDSVFLGNSADRDPSFDFASNIGIPLIGLVFQRLVIVFLTGFSNLAHVLVKSGF